VGALRRVRPAQFRLTGTLGSMRFGFIAVAVLLLAACGGGEASVTTEAVSSGLPSTSDPAESTMPLEPPTSPTESTLASVPESSESTAPNSTTGSEGEGVPIALLEPVLIAAAARSGVDVGEVTVVSAELRDWPDGSLGCPAPGMMYTQVITPGYRVVIEVAGEQLDYRMNRRGAFRLCESGAAIPDIRTPSTLRPGTSLPDTSSPDS
jgi:hypothetical protein